MGAAESELVEIATLLPQIEPAYRESVSLHHYDLLKSEVLLAQGAFDAAIQLVGPSSSSAVPYMHTGHLMPGSVPVANDVAARAYLAKGNVSKAILEYERLVVFDPATMDRRLVGPVCFLRLARLYDTNAMPNKAVATYKRYLQICRNADDQLADLSAAERRLQELERDRSPQNK